MKQLAALAWKEWREVRWTVGVALVAFVALPVIGGLEDWRRSHGFVFVASPWVMALGGALATLAGAAVARDLRGPVAEFWRSRAVGVGRWLVVKYVVGLLTVGLACLVPLLIEAWGERRNAHSDHVAAFVAAWFPFLWAAQFSFGFVCGCLTRRVGPAIMLALALSLLAYFLPLILPLWHASSLMELLESGRAVAPLVVGILAISLGSLLLSILCVRRDWRIRAGQGLMYWSIALVFLLLFASAAFQLATNLPVVQEIPLAPDEYALAIRSDGQRGMLVTRVWQPHRGGGPAARRSFEITASGVTLGPRIETRVFGDDLDGYWGTIRDLVWLPGHPNVCFTLTAVVPLAGRHELSRIRLLALPLSASQPPAIATIEVGTGYDPNAAELPNLAVGEPRRQDCELYGTGDRLLAIWSKGLSHEGSAVIDVSDPARPRVIASDLPMRYRWPLPRGDYSQSFDYSSFLLPLPPLPGVPVRQRLDVAVGMSGGFQAAMQGDVMAFSWYDSLRIYRMAGISEAPVTFRANPRDTMLVELPSGTAEFRQTGHYEPSMLERFVEDYATHVSGGNGFVYESQTSGAFGGGYPRVTVFDVNDPAHPRPVGHFAAPSERPLAVCPQPGGRALIGGKKLYLVGPPRRVP